MNARISLTVVAALLTAGVSNVSHAQATFSEDFTGAATTNSWYFFNGACMTAGASTNTASPGQIPSCMTIAKSYYGAAQDGDVALVGGYNGVAGATQTLPDPVGNGALRFTNGYCSSSVACGHGENGAIVSANAFNAGQGIQITFKTVTYRGDSGGAGKDGADGMSFYLIDGSVSPTSTLWNGIGSWGGSLGYTCSNSNPPYDGLIGAYLGLGIDEFGNFLNGTNLEPGAANTGSLGDNTAIGFGYVPDRIGLRGAGNVSWAYLHATYPTYYPTSMLTSTALQQAAVQKTCSTGSVWNYAASASNPTQVTNPSPALLDYAPIVSGTNPVTGALFVLSSTTPATVLANESAMARPDGVDVQNVYLFNLQITQNGLLSFSFSQNGGAYTPVISSQSITASNGVLPATLRFGFAGSTGGDTNIHEILCFKAAPSTVSSSSAAVNQKQTSQVQTTSQAYFAFYNPNDWTGRVTAFGLVDTAGVLSLAGWANWDTECVLSGVASGQTCTYTGVAGPSTAEPITGGGGRQMLTWNGLDTTAAPGTRGISFEWASLTATEQSVLDQGDTTANANRLNYLRGDRTNEINSAGVGTYRARDGVLGDIVDSSPAFVGPPSSPYVQTWLDRYQGSADTIIENSGQSYSTFIANNQSRLNVLYAGANDGFLHGFRSGAEDALGDVISNTSTPNDGYEVLAYMPGAVLNTIHNSTNTSLDYANPQYAHNFYVDATPGTGDLYYNSAWHTWLVGGLGSGGPAIYALDVTNPSASNYIEGNAASLVLGEWSSSTISCTNVANCGKNLGNTYGTPVIRRFHNGTWGFIFGNGYGSSTGDAGIYVATLTGTSPMTFKFYYLSTGQAAGAGDGIAYVTTADLDGDHITDYVYAGDLKGNVWRFDLTSSTSTNWGTASPFLLFKTATNQPITTPLVVASAVISGSNPQLLVAFGTGQRTQFTNTSATSYVTNATQAIYGVWDWNFATWNTKSGAIYSSLTASQLQTSWGVTGASPLTLSKLQPQTFTVQTGATTTITASNTAITWAQCTSGCSGKFGWYANLPQTNGTTTTGKTIVEQIVSAPQLFENALVLNSTIPANNQPLSCTSPTTDQGVTYAISIVNGGTFGANGSTPTPSTTTFNSAFVNYRETATVGIQTNETGSLSVLNTKESTTWLLGQNIAIGSAGASGGTGNSTGYGGLQQIALQDTAVNRLTWVEMR